MATSGCARSASAARSGDDLVVLSGLTEGERVALDPIAAGVALKARAQARVAAGGHSDD